MKEKMMKIIEAYHLIRKVFNDAGYEDKFVLDLIADLHGEAFGKGYQEGREVQEKVNLLKEANNEVCN